MNLSNFVSQCRPRWQELEKSVRILQNSGTVGQKVDFLRRFAQLYRQASDDLALARTFFADSQVCQYLNSLVSQAHPLIYGRPRQRPLARTADFFARRFPQTFRQCRWTIAAGAILLMLPMLVAYLATLDHAGLARKVLPDAMLDSVDSGQMWTDAIFSLVPGQVLTTNITLNNIGVSFTLFASGMTAGLGAALLLIYNGVMLGCAAGYAQRGHITGDFWSFVVAHGFLELMVIAMTGGAGLELALAIIAPGQLTRGQALRQRGQKAVRLVIGGVPLLIIAGTVEGTISGGSALWLVGSMDVGKLLLGLLLLSLVLFYLITFGRKESDQPRMSLAEQAARSAAEGDQSRPRCLISR